MRFDRLPQRLGVESQVVGLGLGGHGRPLRSRKMPRRNLKNGCVRLSAIALFQNQPRRLNHRIGTIAEAAIMLSAMG
jgi:hypothetical protein